MILCFKQEAQQRCDMFHIFRENILGNFPIKEHRKNRTKFLPFPKTPFFKQRILDFLA